MKKLIAMFVVAVAISALPNTAKAVDLKKASDQTAYAAYLLEFAVLDYGTTSSSSSSSSSGVTIQLSKGDQQILEDGFYDLYVALFYIDVNPNVGMAKVAIVTGFFKFFSVTSPNLLSSKNYQNGVLAIFNAYGALN